MKKHNASRISTLRTSISAVHAKHIHEALHLAQKTRASNILNEALTAQFPRRKNEKGVTSVQFLFLMHLSIARHKKATVEQMLQVALELPDEIKNQIGLPTHLASSNLYKFTKDLGKALDYSLFRAPHISEDEHRLRIQRLDNFVTEYLSGTIYRIGDDPLDYAIDATAIHAPERGQQKPRISSDEYESEGTDESQTPTPENPIISISRRGSKGASDATWRGKTKTSSGSGGQKTEWFFGYFANAVASLPIEPSGQSDRSQIYSFTLSSAKQDMFDASLRAVDAVQKRYGMENLVGDRYYSNLVFDKWWSAMDKRGINPVNDLSPNQQGFVDFDGIKIAAAWPHCPGTPPELGNIDTLPPQPTTLEIHEFEKLISQREQYAMTVQKTFTNGSGRFTCPAMAGKVGCSLRGQENLNHANRFGLAIVENPPQGMNLPKCCVSESVTINVRTKEQKTAFRAFQRKYWGGSEWMKLYRMRSSIERVFGYAKQHHRLDRNTYRFSGLGLSTVVIAVLFAEINIRKLEKWAQEQNQIIEHPIFENPYLLQEENAA